MDPDLMPETLDELELRVTGRFMEITTGGWELPEVAWFNDWAELLKPPSADDQDSATMTTFEISTVGQPLPPPLQFPPLRYITYPNRRYVVLLTCDRALDLWDALTPQKRAQIAFLLEHGGRERVG